MLPANVAASVLLSSVRAVPPVPRPSVRGDAAGEVRVAEIGVVSVGLVPNTSAPVPVSFVTAARRLAELGVARNVATPVPRPETPVEIGRPVALVRVPLAGVPRTGAVIVGLVSVLFVSVSVVALPTRVSVASGSVMTRPAVETASSKVTALAALDEDRNRIPLLKSVPSEIVRSPLPLGCKCIPMFALAPSARM
jgi:hypothetical protein